MPIFEHKSFLDQDPAEVFAWHMRPGALERLTPPWEDVRIIQRSGGIADGGTVTLGLRRGPTELKWHVKHAGFQEGRSFRDEQIRGPFTRWVHTHSFEPGENGGCWVVDHVDWELPLGFAGQFLGGRSVDSELQRLFRFRHRRLRCDLARAKRYGAGKPLKVAITGSGGLVGGALRHVLTTGGHEVVRLVRGVNEAPEGCALWNPDTGLIEREKLEGVDAIVHLAGEPLVGLRWNDAKKLRIEESRTKGTDLIARTVAAMGRPYPVLISASAVGFYGDRGNEQLDERAKQGKGFLAGVCRAWERATEPARLAGARVVNLRIGMVLTPLGGALGTMLLPFKVGVGGRLGSGKQYVSWIDHDDVVGLILHAIRSERFRGPVNATAPYPVPNSTFTNTLGRVLGRPTVLPVPSIAVKALFGEMGTELLLTGARVKPGLAESDGFEYFFPALEESLRFQLGREEG
jgi:uncharacterized protein (TIGR01777 family)